MLDFNQLFILTPRSNVFVVRKLSDSIQEPKSYLDKDKNRNPSFKYINEIILRHGNENGGVIVGLSRTIKRFQQSNNYEHRKNNYKTTNNTEIPWNPDNFNGYINESRNRLDLSKLLNNQFSYDRTTNVSKSNQNYKFNRFKRSLDADSFSKLINLWNKLRARNKNPTANKFNRPYKSRPHFSPSNRPHPMTALNLTNSFINNLQNNWIWKPFVPDMDISVVGPANIIFVLDLDNRDQLPLIRRFLFNTMLLFPLPLTKFTILIHENMMLKEFLVRKTFSLAEDIMKMVLSLDFTHGKIFSIPYLPLFLQLSAQKDLFSKIKDVTIVYTTKASLDFMTYDKTGKKVAADFPILYILGASIPFPIQKMFFSQMANPNRLFLEATFDSLFSEKNLKQLVISLKKDLQTSNIILDLSNDSTNYGHSKRFPNSRNGNNNTKAKDNRKNNLKSRGEYKNRNGKFKKLSKRQVNRFKDYAASQSTSLGPANIIYLVDTTMNQQSLSNVKKMISGLINLYPRVGSYHSLIGFEDYPSRISTLEQLLSSGHINSVLNSLKKRGGNLRLTGQALSLAVNSFSSANPGLVNILFVIICGKSTDFYKQVALEAKRHGIVTIAINFGGPPDASTEAASIATTTQRAFYVNPSKSSNVPFKLKFFLETTSGSLKNPSNGIAQVINEWSWSSHDNFQLNKKISPSEISFLLDLTGSPRNVINLAFNLINRFSRQSLVSLHSIGHSGIGSEYYNKFYNMADLTVLQLVLQSFIGNSVPIPGQLSNLRRPFKKKDKVRFFERGSSVARLFPNYRPKSRLGTFESQDTSDFDVDYPDTESVGNEVRFSKKYTWCQITSRLQSIVKLYEKSEFVGNSGPVINRVLFLILSSRPVSKSTNDQSSDNCKNKELLFLTQSFKSYGVHLFVIDALRTVSVGSQFQKFKWNYYGQKWNSLLSTSKIIVDKLMKTFGVSTGFNLLFRDSNFDQFLSIKKHFSQSDYKILATDLSITSLVPTLAPPIDQLLTTKFLLKVDNLKKVWRWRNIIPGLKYENIDGDINVILMVDISRGWNFFAVQQAVINTIALFNGNSVRFSLITYSSVGKAKIVYLNKFYSGFSFIKKDIISNLNSDAMLNLKIRKTKLAGALSFIRRRVIKELRPAVSNLLIIISSSQSSTTQPSFNEANKLKNFGVIISVIGIGINYNPGELLRIASNGHLFVHSVESMLPVALFRLQFVFTAIFNEPFTKSGKLTISNLTPYEPKLTINIRGTLPLKGKPKNSRKQPELPTNSEPISFTPPPNVSSDSDNGNSQ